MTIYVTANFKTEGSNFLHATANACFAPANYLFGHTYEIFDNQAKEIVPQKSDRTWIKTTLMVAALVPGLILGIVPRLLSFAFQEVRNGFKLISAPAPKQPVAPSQPKPLTPTKPTPVSSEKSTPRSADDDQELKSLEKALDFLSDDESVVSNDHDKHDEADCVNHPKTEEDGYCKPCTPPPVERTPTPPRMKSIDSNVSGEIINPIPTLPVPLDETTPVIVSNKSTPRSNVSPEPAISPAPVPLRRGKSVEPTVIAKNSSPETKKTGNKGAMGMAKLIRAKTPPPASSNETSEQK